MATANINSGFFFIVFSNILIDVKNLCSYLELFPYLITFLAELLQRAPVVGILTRHDFMPEHILGLHPFLLKSRWKRLRFGKSTIVKFFRSLC